MPLDGMRAIAIFWVFCVHIFFGLGDDVYGYFDICFKTNDTLYTALSWMRAGALGVDIFFVLSGFLIAYILMKEHRKYGSIDAGSFFRGRFIRIWFVIAVYAPVEFILLGTDKTAVGVQPAYYRIQRAVSQLTFTCNIAWQ